MIHVLDIRTPKEYCSGHIKGAVNIPTPLPPLTSNQVFHLKNLLLKYIHNLDPKDILYVYCKKGRRSRIAADILRNQGWRVGDLGGVEDIPLQTFFGRYPKDVKYC